MIEDKELEKIKMKKMIELAKKTTNHSETISDKPIHLTSANFDKVVNQSKVPVLVDFWAAWCMPCLAMAPVMDALAKKYAGKIIVGKVNVDENPQLAARFRTMSIPTFILFKNGKPVERVVGAIGLQIENIIKKHL
ncbi:MAG: thioredoxin [Candidatus Odinarchaeia archaeon]